MAFVVSAGRLEAVHRQYPTAWAAQAAGAVSLADDVYRDYAHVYRRQSNVRTVVSFLARNIAQLGLHTYRRLSDTDRERLTGETHAVPRLLDRPNPWTTTYRLVNDLVSDLAIYDDAFLVKVRSSDQPLSLVRVPPQYMFPYSRNWITAERWLLVGPSGDLELDAADVVHFRGYNPLDPKVGLSPMETLRELLAEEYEAGRWRQQMWRNGARASGFISRPHDAPRWSKEARDNFRDYLKNAYSGHGGQAGGTLLLEDGMVFTTGGLDPKAAQYVESRKLTREEVASAYHIPLPLVGILDHATYSNIAEQHKMLYQDTLGPWLSMIIQELHLQLLPDPGLPDTRDVYLEFNLAEKLRGSFEEQASAASTATGGPWMTRNEQRARFNLPALEGADELITPLNVTEGGLASPTDTAPDEPSTEGAGGDGAAAALAPAAKRSLVLVKAAVQPGALEAAERALQEFFVHQGAVVASQVGGKTARGLRKAAVDQVFNRERWDRELTEVLSAVNVRTATAAGTAAMGELGLDLEYDEDRTLEWLAANAAVVAGLTNQATRLKLTAALAEADALASVQHVFEVLADGGASRLARTQCAHLAGWGTKEAGRQAAWEVGAYVRKTWHTNSTNPRSTHAALNGQTVGVDEVFTNGAQGPGDPVLPPEERANCECSLIIQAETEG